MLGTITDKDCLKSPPLVMAQAVDGILYNMMTCTRNLHNIQFVSTLTSAKGLLSLSVFTATGTDLLSIQHIPFFTSANWPEPDSKTTRMRS